MLFPSILLIPSIPIAPLATINAHFTCSLPVIVLSPNFCLVTAGGPGKKGPMVTEAVSEGACEFPRITLWLPRALRAGAGLGQLNRAGKSRLPQFSQWTREPRVLLISRAHASSCQHKGTLSSQDRVSHRLFRDGFLDILSLQDPGRMKPRPLTNSQLMGEAEQAARNLITHVNELWNDPHHPHHLLGAHCAPGCPKAPQGQPSQSPTGRNCHHLHLSQEPPGSQRPNAQCHN